MNFAQRGSLAPTEPLAIAMEPGDSGLEFIPSAGNGLWVTDASPAELGVEPGPSRFNALTDELGISVQVTKRQTWDEGAGELAVRVLDPGDLHVVKELRKQLSFNVPEQKVSLKVPGLSAGRYLVEASVAGDFNQPDTLLAVVVPGVRWPLLIVCLGSILTLFSGLALARQRDKRLVMGALGLVALLLAVGSAHAMAYPSVQTAAEKARDVSVNPAAPVESALPVTTVAGVEQVVSASAEVRQRVGTAAFTLNAVPSGGDRRVWLLTSITSPQQASLVITVSERTRSVVEVGAR